MAESFHPNQRTNGELNKEMKQRLSLDRPATYQIKVPGQLDESWSEWLGGFTVSVESKDDEQPITTLVGNTHWDYPWFQSI